MGLTRTIISRLHALSEASLTLNSSLDLDEILSSNVNYITETLNVDRGTLYLIDRPRKQIWSKFLKADEMVEIRLPMGKGLAGYVAETGQDVIITDAYADERFDPSTDKRTGYKTKNMVVLPIINRRQEQIGVLQLINKKDGDFLESDIEFARSLGEIAAVGIENAMLYKQNLANAELQKELKIANQIQESLIPVEHPPIPGYESYIFYKACTEIGGDYTDIIPLEENKFALIMTDVSGHGIPAALLMTMINSAITAYVHEISDLAILTKKLNDLIYKKSTSDKYATFFIGILDTKAHTINYCNAGHPSPVLISSDSVLLSMTASGPPIGMIPGMTYESGTIQIGENDLFFLYTDGITENFNEHDEEYGEDRMSDLLLREKKSDCKVIVDTLFAEIDDFCHFKDAEDDRTVLLLKRK